MKHFIKQRQLSRGFTLIEIVLVVALISISATAVIALIDPVQQFRKTNDAKRKSDLRQLQAAFELYRADQGIYPPSLPACGSALTVGTVTYMQRIPCDPKYTAPSAYIYTYTNPTPSTYVLIGCLENLRDPQKDAANVAPCAGGTTNWSYTLTNP